MRSNFLCCREHAQCGWIFSRFSDIRAIIRIENIILYTSLPKHTYNYCNEKTSKLKIYLVVQSYIITWYRINLDGNSK